MTEELDTFEDTFDDLDGMCGLTAQQWQEICQDDDPERDCVAFATKELADEFVEEKDGEHVETD